MQELQTNTEDLKKDCQQLKAYFNKLNDTISTIKKDLETNIKTNDENIIRLNEDKTKEINNTKESLDAILASSNEKICTLDNSFHQIESLLEEEKRKNTTIFKVKT